MMRFPAIRSFLLICLTPAMMCSSLATMTEPVRRQFSTAGFYAIKDGGRDVYDFNAGWRFHKGPLEGGESIRFDDSSWPVVNCPHGLELLPENASGSINYQGEAWYRKHFKVPASMKGKRSVLYFEAIMGKSRIWINGVLMKEHFGGFLPIVIDVTHAVELGEQNVVVVMADNSNDPSYPPGKPQETLDFAYFGGIYRDVWLYSTAPVHITDPNEVDEIAGGGVFAHFESRTADSVDVVVSAHVANHTAQRQTLSVSSIMLDADGDAVGEGIEALTLEAGKSGVVVSRLRVGRPHLWHPDDPYLHRLVCRILNEDGVIDGVATRIGIRKVEFRGREGLFLNGQPFGDKLMGANRHQDHALIGNAMPNSLHWRDARKLRNAGLRIIRSAHYPQDPAFMDACDELGLFVIVATPGWQFWNDDPTFADRVVSDVRNMVRRDRNRPSVILWEPILNETHYPEGFAKRARDVTHEEYPFEGCHAAADEKALGSEHFEVLYSGADFKHDKSTFTGEWGDNVDDWSSQNSPSRVHRSWGETPMLVQAQCYADARPLYTYGSWEHFYRMSTPQLVGGCLWHSFDHHRGYHPDNFFGGIMDSFRQAKYSYHLFQSQRDPGLNVPQIDSGPMVYIANEMTPFSSPTVRVFSNCEEVRLIVFGREHGTKRPRDSGLSMPSPPVEFDHAYDSQQIRALHRAGKFEEACIVAEGLISGKVVAVARRWPAKRAHRLVLSIDFDGAPLIADGSDLVTVIASLVDEQGNVKRLGVGTVLFEVSGEGRLLGDSLGGANPCRLAWGTAPCLVQATTVPGRITVTARALFEGIHTPASGAISWDSLPSSNRLLFSEQATHSTHTLQPIGRSRNPASKKDDRLHEVGTQQAEFEHH